MVDGLLVGVLYELGCAVFFEGYFCSGELVFDLLVFGWDEAFGGYFS